MQRALQFLLAALGLSAILIGLSFIFLGAFTTGQFFQSLLSPIIGTTPVPAAFQDPSIASEFAFYATFWIVFGGYTLNAARTPTTNAPAIAAAIFLCAGLARIPALHQFGPPHPLFIFLMGVEMTLPILLLLLWKRTRNRTDR